METKESGDVRQRKPQNQACKFFGKKETYFLTSGKIKRKNFVSLKFECFFEYSAKILCDFSQKNDIFVRKIKQNEIFTFYLRLFI